MAYSFHNVIEILSSILAVLFAIFLLSSSRKKYTSNIYIALFLLLLALNISHNFIELLTDRISLNLSDFLMMTAYLMAPSFYFYVKASIDPGFKLSLKDSIHLIPFIVFNGLIFKDVYLANFNGIEPVEVDRNIDIILYFGFYLQVFFYLALSFRMLWNYKQLYFENYSNTDIRKFKYLFQFVSILALVFIVSGVKNYIVFTSNGQIIEDSIHIVLLLIFLLFCWIIYNALNSPELFNANVNQLKPISTIVNEENRRINDSRIKYSKVVINENSDELADKVKSYMQIEKPFLDPALSINELSKKTDIPSRELSLLINHHLKKHFFDFVNEYRISAAVEILKDPSKRELTVLEILYEVGFNSKSSFNTSFKKLTGLTPTQYRNKHMLVEV